MSGVSAFLLQGSFDAMGVLMQHRAFARGPWIRLCEPLMRTVAPTVHVTCVSGRQEDTDSGGVPRLHSVWQMLQRECPCARCRGKNVKFVIKEEKLPAGHLLSVSSLQVKGPATEIDVFKIINTLLEKMHEAFSFDLKVFFTF